MGTDEDGDQVVPAGRVLDHRHRYPPDGRAVSLGELHAVPAQGGQALAPGEERDVVVPGLMQAGGEQAAGNPGAVHEQFHGNLLSGLRSVIRSFYSNVCILHVWLHPTPAPSSSTRLNASSPST